jgi:hypothetical protein
MTNNPIQNEGRGEQKETQVPGKPQMGDAQPDEKNRQQDQERKPQQRQQDDAPSKQPS